LNGRPRLLDVVDGRGGSALHTWVSGRDQAWRDGVRVAALDPFRGYATALRTSLPNATRVLDAFHVVRLGLDALDQVRRAASNNRRWVTAATATTRCFGSADCCAAATNTTPSSRGTG
jgi:transposase